MMSGIRFLIFMVALSFLVTQCVASLDRSFANPSVVMAQVAGAGTPTPQPSPSPTPNTLSARATQLDRAVDIARPGEWVCEVFGNRDLYAPSLGIETYAVLSANWGHGGPMSSQVIDRFSMRCATRWIVAAPENLQLIYQADDGIRVYIGGQIRHEAWLSGRHTGVINTPLTAGEHRVQIEFFDAQGASYLAVHLSNDCAGWVGRVYANTEFAGRPELILCAPAPGGNLSVDFGAGSPGAGVPADNFSVQWERTVTVDRARVLTLTAQHDDALMILLGNRVLYEARTPNTGQTSVLIPPGTHTLTARFVERGGPANLDIGVRQ